MITSLRTKYPTVELPLLYNEIFQPQTLVQTVAPVHPEVVHVSPMPIPVSTVNEPTLNHPSNVIQASSPHLSPPERLSPDIIAQTDTVTFGDLELPENNGTFNFNPYSHLAAYANMAALEINADLSNHIHSLPVRSKQSYLF